MFLALATTAVGLLFKISAAPFHMWAPDAYEGAPTSVTAFLSVGSKAASFALLLRIFLGPLASMRVAWEPLLIAVAVLSMTVGNLAAVTQTNTKRLLAYSSISHAGYMLLGLVAGNATGINGVLVYILVYSFMNLGAFLVLIALCRKNIIGEDIDDLAGLMQKSPTYAILMLIFLLSLAGIPPTAGFIGKYYIFLSLVRDGPLRAGRDRGAVSSRWRSTTTSAWSRACSCSRSKRATPLTTSFGHARGARADRASDSC